MKISSRASLFARISKSGRTSYGKHAVVSHVLHPHRRRLSSAARNPIAAVREDTVKDVLGSPPSRNEEDTYAAALTRAALPEAVRRWRRFCNRLVAENAASETLSCPDFFVEDERLQTRFSEYLKAKFPEVCAKWVRREEDSPPASSSRTPASSSHTRTSKRSFAPLIAIFRHFLWDKYATQMLAYEKARSSADLRRVAEHFPEARKRVRKVFLHLGPTNSGKTHNALQALMRAESGAYCGPLRLLALEKFEEVGEKFMQRAAASLDILERGGELAERGGELAERKLGVMLLTGQERRRKEHTEYVLIEEQGVGDDQAGRSSSAPGCEGAVVSCPAAWSSGTTSEKMNKRSTNCSHLSCTTEMFPTDRFFDVVVLDEVQLLTDRDRGGAWTRVLLGAQCEELHLCGLTERPELMERLLHALLEEKCGDLIVEKRRYERLSPLICDERPVVASTTVGSSEQGRSSFGAPVERSSTGAASYEDLRPGDCCVCFSRQDIFRLRDEIGRAKPELRIFVAYGTLPPEQRRAQARAYNANVGTSLLIATDCIGLGLNFRIKRIVFSTLHKYDGKARRRLSDFEIRQIAGRAGRGASGEPGHVGCFTKEELEAVRTVLAAAPAVGVDVESTSGRPGRGDGQAQGYGEGGRKEKNGFGDEEDVSDADELARERACVCPDARQIAAFARELFPEVYGPVERRTSTLASRLPHDGAAGPEIVEAIRNVELEATASTSTNANGDSLKPPPSSDASSSPHEDDPNTSGAAAPTSGAQHLPVICDKHLPAATSSIVTKRKATARFSLVLENFALFARISGQHFRLQGLETMRRIAVLVLDDLTAMSPEDNFVFCSAPVDLNEPAVVLAVRALAQQYADFRRVLLPSVYDYSGLGKDEELVLPQSGIVAPQEQDGTGAGRSEAEGENGTAESSASSSASGMEGVVDLSTGGVDEDGKKVVVKTDVARDGVESTTTSCSIDAKTSDIDEETTTDDLFPDLNNNNINISAEIESGEDPSDIFPNVDETEANVLCPPVPVPDSVRELRQLENVYKVCDVYLWLANHFDTGASGGSVLDVERTPRKSDATTTFFDEDCEGSTEEEDGRVLGGSTASSSTSGSGTTATFDGDSRIFPDAMAAKVTMRRVSTAIGLALRKRLVLDNEGEGAPGGCGDYNMAALSDQRSSQSGARTADREMFD